MPETRALIEKKTNIEKKQTAVQKELEEEEKNTTLTV